MKQLTTAILLIALVAGTLSCKKDHVGEGPVSTQSRSIGSFEGIDLRMNGSVYYTAGQDRKLEISAKESIHGMLETSVINNRLVIRYANGKTYDSDESIRIYVTGPNVSSFELNTSGSIYCQNPISVANLYLRSSGSGNITLQQVDAISIEALSAQSGKISANGGSCTNEKLKTDGSGKIDLSAIAAKRATAQTIGSGDIRVKVSESLDATIDGSGSIYFTGTPLITSHLHGSGKLIRF